MKCPASVQPLFAFGPATVLLWLAGTLLGAANPGEFRSGELWADNQGVPINAHGGGVLFHAGSYYWFGEHKVGGPEGNTAQVGVAVYSSADLTHWKNEGIALKVSADPQSDIAQGCILERPKVIFNARTGKFVMWFHLEPKGQGYRGARSGIAVSDRVAGPYRFLESLRPNAGVWPMNVPPELRTLLDPAETAQLAQLNLTGGPAPGYPPDTVFRRDFAGGQMARDLTLFVDDDGTAYHIYASEENGTLQISQLSDDYLKPAGKYARIFPGGFNEAPAIFKHGGKYWLITSGCTGWAPNAARLAVANTIWGPWAEVGNPWIGVKADTDLSFDSQSTFVLPIAGAPDNFVFIADRWRPDNPIDGRYLWLPVGFSPDGRPYLQWRDHWKLN